MKTTIDGAGRVVIPKRMRDALGLSAGTEVDIVIDGTAIRIDGPDAPDPEMVEINGMLVVKGIGQPLPADVVHQMREERMDSLEQLGLDA